MEKADVHVPELRGNPLKVFDSAQKPLNEVTQGFSEWSAGEIAFVSSFIHDAHLASSERTS